MIEVIISGGQTGADRAALDFALERGFEIQGYCPHGRRADDGSLDAKYPLQETKSAAYPPRTRLNVKLADATIIFNGLPEYSSGTHAAIRYAREHKKKFKVLRGFPDVMQDAADLRQWLKKHKPQKLNVAGNGEEKCPGIYAHALAVLRQVIP
ncbi:MAG: putative molybdenum carrier protein [Deltaproteobacteria bacterium]|jgi:predicted Rossmann fold nucleotide-binding protein DprA/Smf involved in DNA uptake|nr:putative molybdenum carrier protein [Deltaproteobacteria bacterium]